jgi:magnesium-transporting ATPase (P-type)
MYGTNPQEPTSYNHLDYARATLDTLSEGVRMAESKGYLPDIDMLTRVPVDRLFENLRTGPEGLSNELARRRLKEHGPNILPEAKKQPLTRKAAVQFKNLFNVLLIVAAILSFITGFSSNDVSSIEMGVAIIFVVVVSVLFSLFQEHRAERAIEALRLLVPENIRVMRDRKVVHVPASEVVPGDVVALEEGDKVPADARLINAFQFSVDNSVLTGEAEPQPRYDVCKNLADCAAEDITNLVFAGTTVASGSGLAVVLATGANTRFGQVVGIARAIEEPLSPLQREINLTARLNFLAAIAIGVLFLVIALQFLRLPISDSILFMIGVMVCVVPEGLQITLTLSLALSSLAMSKRNVVVKRLSSAETLGSVTVICTDKTGTITEGQMTVRKVWTSGDVLDVSGEGYEPEGAVYLKEEELKASGRKDLETLCETAALDNKATLVPPLDRRKYRWTAVGDTTDAALLVLAAKAGLDPKKTLEERPRVGMIPFESTRKMMTSIHQDKHGTVQAYVKGAGSEIVARSKNILWKDKVIPLTGEISMRILTQMDDFAREAYRVIALAVRDLPGKSDKYDSESVETELTFIGLVAILDPPRRDVEQAVLKARKAGIKIVMLTGDHVLTAEAIARSVGIITSSDSFVMSCEKLHERSDAELSDMLNVPELVFARVTPEQKLRIVHLFKEKGETVAVTGDGVNDAPALLEADIGIAMGITGTDVARESADMVLLDDNFASIVSGVEVGRSVFDNLKKFIAYVFSHNWAELMTFIVFVLLQTPLPLAVVGVLTIDLLLEILPSISLTMEPPELGIMDRPPRSRTSRLFDIKTLARSFYIGSLTGIVAILWCFSVWHGAGWTLGMASMTDREAYLKGTTVVLVGIMAGQLGNFFATRTNIRSSFTISIRANKWLLPSLAAELAILLAIIYVPFIQPIFGSRPLQPIEWIYLFSFAPVILLLEEVRKYFVRTIMLPAPPIHVPPPVPITAPTRAYTPARATRRAPFVQVGSPVIVLSSTPEDVKTALPLAVGIAEQSGSKIVVASTKALLEREREFLATAGIPSEYIKLETTKTIKEMRSAALAVKRYADRVGAEMIVVPIRASMFTSHRARKRANWISELSDKRVVLVSAPKEQKATLEPIRRLVIPVLDEFHPEVFALAGALTSSAKIPDVDVVAAKVIKIPPTIPLYSTYRPESLVDTERELSFLRSVSGLPVFRTLSAKVLLVRDVSRDLVEFAKERRADMILFRGDWNAIRRGFLTEKERRIAANAPSYVLLMLPPTKRLR